MGFKHESPIKGATDIWLTPRHIIEALGPFDLDPCAAPAPRPWPTARLHYDATIGQDGLSLPWEGCVWLNPPYGPQAGPWVKRLAEHGDGIALVFARMETVWMQAILPWTTRLLFPAGRLTFCTPDGRPGPMNSGAPSVFLAFGNGAAERLERLKLPGFFAVAERKKALDTLGDLA